MKKQEIIDNLINVIEQTLTGRGDDDSDCMIDNVEGAKCLGVSCDSCVFDKDYFEDDLKKVLQKPEVGGCVDE